MLRRKRWHDVISCPTPLHNEDAPEGDLPALSVCFSECVAHEVREAGNISFSALSGNLHDWARKSKRPIQVHHEDAFSATGYWATHCWFVTGLACESGRPSEVVQLVKSTLPAHMWCKLRRHPMHESRASSSPKDGAVVGRHAHQLRAVYERILLFRARLREQVCLASNVRRRLGSSKALKCKIERRIAEVGAIHDSR